MILTGTRTRALFFLRINTRNASLQATVACGTQSKQASTLLCVVERLRRGSSLMCGKMVLSIIMLFAPEQHFVARTHMNSAHHICCAFNLYGSRLAVEMNMSSSPQYRAYAAHQETRRDNLQYRTVYAAFVYLPPQHSTRESS